MTAEQVILAYWRSWQKPDFVEFQGYLADTVMVSGMPVPASGLAHAASQGSRWRDVTLVDSVFSPDGGAILSSGVNTANGAVMKAAEFCRVRDGKIVALNLVLLADGAEVRF